MNDLKKLYAHDFLFTKKLGQNFIFDKNLLRAIVQDTGVDKNTTVVEIGTGAGTLTREIAKHAKRVITYEVDTALQPFLLDVFLDYDNITLKLQDIMQVDVTALEKEIGENYIIIANLPYYITTPVIFKFIENAKNLLSMHVMVQLEVAKRICAVAGTADYGAITPSIDSIANAKITRRVGRNNFVPVPNVDSAIVKIEYDKNKYDIHDPNTLSKLIKAAFAMRRKTLKNNLKASFGFTDSFINDLFVACNLKDGIRGERLTTSQFVEISNWIFKNATIK